MPQPNGDDPSVGGARYGANVDDEPTQDLPTADQPSHEDVPSTFRAEDEDRLSEFSAVADAAVRIDSSWMNDLLAKVDPLAHFAQQIKAMTSLNLSPLPSVADLVLRDVNPLAGVADQVAAMTTLNLPPIPSAADIVFRNLDVRLPALDALVRLPRLDLTFPAIDFAFPQLPFDAEAFQRLYERFKPRNLRGEVDHDIEQIEAVMQGDGIPFCLVPDAETVDMLLIAPDRAARRTVLISRADAIFISCDDIISLCVDADLPVYGHMTRRAIAAYDDGHWEAAQTLATVVLDALVARHQNHTNLKSAADGPEFISGKMGNRDAFFLLPLPVVHTRTAKITDPEAYNRHATVHDSSPVQLTRSNAVQAIMLATSLLGFYQNLW